MKKAANVSDYRALAKARLPHFLFEYLDGGSYDEVTLRRNVEDLQSIALRQRVLRDVSNIDPSTELFGVGGPCPSGWGLLDCPDFMFGAARFRRREPRQPQMSHSSSPRLALVRFGKSRRRGTSPGISSTSLRIAASSAR